MNPTARIRLVRGGLLGGVLLLAALGSLALWLRPNGLLLDLLRATQWNFADTPRIFGTYHLIMFAIAILTAAALIVFYPKLRLDARRMDSLLFAMGIVLLVLEVYKQWYHAVVLGNGHYNFGILPLQLCSYSLYLYLLIPFLKEGKIKAALLDFVALYQTMGACIVLGYPALYRDVALSLHTMIWHIVMVAVGAIVLCYTMERRTYRAQMLSSMAVFLPTVALAILLNILLKPLSLNSPQPLNLFYISPYETSGYIIIGDVQAALGWFPSVLTYVALYLSIGVHTVYGLGWLVRKMKKRVEMS